ncbi:MAG: hypothetical protein U0694_13100 [Anaerolineae bacterium]
MDEALEMAAKIPAAKNGSIEIRPIVNHVLRVRLNANVRLPVFSLHKIPTFVKSQGEVNQTRATP